MKTLAEIGPRLAGLGVAALLLSAGASVAVANDDRIEFGGQFVVTRESEFDSTDPGFGARFGLRLTRGVFLDTELNYFPGDLTEERPFSAHRLEGLFGVRVGRRWEKAGVFGKFRSGFLSFGESSEAFPCILIFPPPLECALAGGDTVLAFDFGGVVELYPSARSFIRFDAGDQMLRFQGPVLRSNGEPVEDSFFGHNFRFTIGVGARF